MFKKKGNKKDIKEYLCIKIKKTEEKNVSL